RWETYPMEMTLRQAHRCDPQHPLARKTLAAHLRQSAAEHFNARQYKKAEPLYLEAHEIDPGDTLTLAYLIQTQFRLRKPREARKHLDLALATESLEGLADLLTVLALEGRLSEVDEVVARAEALDLAVEVLVNAGVDLLARASPPIGLLGLSNAAPPPDSPVIRIANQLIERGIAASENEAEGLAFVLGALGPDRIELGLSYAERLAKLLPDDPHSQLLFAMSLGYGGQRDRAFSILDKAERLARRAGDRKLRDEIAGLREELEAPPESLLPLLGQLPPGVFDDLDFLDELPGRGSY
ncbi:MAG: hypothetical protein ACO1SX_20695, partial [Actinomycetota bacterium]